MTTIGIGQLRSDTRRYVERVESGETFHVLRRGRPVAQLRAHRPDEVKFLAMPLRDLRTRAATALDRVATGETIVIEHHGRTVAILQPIPVS